MLNKHIRFVAVLIFGEDFSDFHFAALASLFDPFKVKEQFPKYTTAPHRF